MARKVLLETPLGLLSFKMANTSGKGLVLEPQNNKQINLSVLARKNIGCIFFLICFQWKNIIMHMHSRAKIMVFFASEGHNLCQLAYKMEKG